MNSPTPVALIIKKTQFVFKNFAGVRKALEGQGTTAGLHIFGRGCR